MTELQIIRKTSQLLITYTRTRSSYCVYKSSKNSSLEKLPNCRLNQPPPINFPWLIIDYQKIIKSRVGGTDESRTNDFWLLHVLIAGLIFLSKPPEKIAFNQFVVIHREMRVLWYQRVIMIFIFVRKSDYWKRAGGIIR